MYTISLEDSVVSFYKDGVPVEPLFDRNDNDDTLVARLRLQEKERQVARKVALSRQY